MVRSKLVLVLVCATLVACTPDLTQRERMVERQAVQEQLTTWVRVLNNAKLDSILAMYYDGPEARIMWPNGSRSMGTEEVEQAWRGFYGGIQYMNFVMTDPAVEILSPRIAVTTFSHSTDVVRLSGRTVEAGHGTLLWMKDSDDGVWRIYLQQLAIRTAGRN
jgi:ketosteroid isomerase-like protein